MAKKKTITAAEASYLTGLSERTVQRYCQEGKIRAEKDGRGYQIEKTSVKEFMAKRKKAQRAAKKGKN